MALFCEPCAQNANCESGTAAIPYPGYVKPHETSTLIVRCFNKEACSGDGNDQIQNCAPGYEGNMCASCQSGYWKNPDTFTCNKCETEPTMGKFGMLAAFFAVVFVIYRMFQFSKVRINAELIAIVRITINTL